jgi:hypothetical protein
MGHPGFVIRKRLACFAVLEGGADFFDVGAVSADGFVELVAGDVELFGPVGDVGGHFGVDLFGIVRALGVFFVDGVGFVGFGCFVMFGHVLFLFPLVLVRWMRMCGVGDVSRS